jgi:hypothetical protein
MYSTDLQACPLPVVAAVRPLGQARPCPLPTGVAVVVPLPLAPVVPHPPAAPMPALPPSLVAVAAAPLLPVPAVVRPRRLWAVAVEAVVRPHAPALLPGSPNTAPSATLPVRRPYLLHSSHFPAEDAHG